MAISDHYDFIIAGAGAAGLSLLHALIRSKELSSKKILLVDRQLKPVREKTWCFWDDQNLALREAIHHSWKTLEVRYSGDKFVGSLNDTRYYCIQNGDFTRMILEDAQKCGQVTILEADIYGFVPVSGGAVMHTSKGKFTAHEIFQSALIPPGFSDNPMDISLKQHFAGWRIRTDRAVFDPEKATLMDFETEQQGGVTFFYVLPYNEQEALIEYTIFSGELLPEKMYSDKLEHYIQKLLGEEDLKYSIVHSENGVIPMEDRRYPVWYCDHVLNLGTIGGMTKPSTGYTFTRILEHSSAIVDALEKNRKLPEAPASSFRFRVYDIMILYLMESDPARVEKIFIDMFRINGFEKILTFLDEKTRFKEELKIFSALPYAPFFKAIWKMKHRIFMK